MNVLDSNLCGGFEHASVTCKFLDKVGRTIFEKVCDNLEGHTLWHTSAIQLRNQDIWTLVRLRFNDDFMYTYIAMHCIH